jgi:DUF1365 family protein
MTTKRHGFFLPVGKQLNDIVILSEAKDLALSPFKSIRTSCTVKKAFKL